MEHDPYSLIKYINIINANNDGYGYPTINAFVEMELLETNEILFCRINSTEYECHIEKNEKDQYVLCYQDKIKEGNVMKFIHKLSKLIKIRIRRMGIALDRIRRASNNQTLYILSFDLEKNFEDRLTQMLLDSEFGIWDINTAYNYENKEKKFLCKSNMKYDDILKIINSNDINHNDIDNDTYKEKQQLYSLLKHDAIEIIYQPITDDDIIQLEKCGDDICHGSGIYKDVVHLEDSIAFFVKDINNNDHYALTAKHVLHGLDTSLLEIKSNINSRKNLYIDWDNIIELTYDAELFKIRGNPCCHIFNLNCTALSSYVYEEYLSSSESSSESSDESNDAKSLKQLYERSRNPIHVDTDSLKSLLNRHKPNKVPIFKYGAATNLTVRFIKEIDRKTILDNTNYRNVIEVEWIDGIEFARGGDSGSLYFVHDSTTNAFVPVAMHVGSKRRRSFGILLKYIFKELAEQKHQFLMCDSTDCQQEN
ncbi:unnamed protein product [Rotaria magnacalcarata]|uniref:Uncharacterized protein n=1 Tax=Rotaria magnacalcarata TaxID=392030 RepID=A0A816GS74_9BILA|nr:unnamed protein product [Rotaria magnacalcarata]CAF2135289.1 unnamed protein product [Rotaria magnacalcarata]CAF3907623.1 unnamed protein product [Rotaria magnacalcarata]CAF4123598.1 unnamed protein product [Rotaria magnacalcarata]